MTLSADLLGRDATFLGIDLGWSSGWTGLAVTDEAGALTASTRVRTDDEIVSWIGAHAPGVVVAAVDGPLIVTNDVGQRDAERLIGVAFGAFGASAHVTNRRKFGGADPRGKVLADRLGWRTDPGSGPGTPGSPLCLEVYPHPALIGLFGLDYRLLYKKGTRAQRMAGMAALVGYIASVPELRVHEYPRWAELVAHVADPGPGVLDRVEDELDAIVCAHLAWLWHRRPGTLEVYGDGASGYIVAPPRPTHRPVRPAAASAAASATATPRALTRTVVGRPTGYAGGTHEQAWKSAVRAAFADVPPVPGRVAVEVDFWLEPAQTGRNEPDLDNLLKSTIDALGGVLGARSGIETRHEADDARVDRIVAGKSWAPDGRGGARISVRPTGR